MTDRELLENAAKAAGIVIKEWDYGEPVVDSTDGNYNFNWNPLTDDGDALRLAAMLGISVSYDRLDQGVDERRVFAVHFRGVEYEHLGTDPYAATRRAIVRAAAEIGRNMA